MTNYKNNTLSFLVPSRIDTMVWQHVRWPNHDHLGMEDAFRKGHDSVAFEEMYIYPYVHVITLSLNNMRPHPVDPSSCALSGSCGSTARRIKCSSQILNDTIIIETPTCLALQSQWIRSLKGAIIP